MSTDYHDLLGPPEWLSACCGAVALFELSPEYNGERAGLCSECKCHATFKKHKED